MTTTRLFPQCNGKAWRKVEALVIKGRAIIYVSVTISIAVTIIELQSRLATNEISALQPVFEVFLLLCITLDWKN